MGQAFVENDESPGRPVEVITEDKWALVEVTDSCRFLLANGSYQKIVGSNNFVGIRQSSVSRCIRKICNVLNSTNILWIRFSGNIEELENICDITLKIPNVNARPSGNTHESFI
nr:unnamed protein product [Callosobruchus analis]